MICTCGGILSVKNIEEYPKHLAKQKRLSYNRVCDVECLKCGKIFFSQPYDFGSNINQVRPINPKIK